MSILDQLAQAIQKVEGYYPPGSVVGGVSYPNGSVAYRNNNPGNLNYVGQAGATGADANGYAIFPDYATGYAALTAQIQLDANRGMTLQQLIYSWAPPTGDPRGNNNTTAYLQSVSDSTGLAPGASVQNAIANDSTATSAGLPGNADASDVTSGDGSNNSFSLSSFSDVFSNFSSDASATLQSGDVSNMQVSDWLVVAAIGAALLFVFQRR
jgi:hypothetical protein